jgi:subtilase family serine protease
VVAQLAFTGEDFALGTLGPGETATAVFSVDTTGFVGFNTLEVVVDPYLQIAETSEINNSAQVSVEVMPLVDLRVTGGGLTPNPVEEGAPVDVNAFIQNFGELPAVGVQVAAFDGAPELGGVRLGPNMNVGDIGGGLAGTGGQRPVLFSFSTSALSLGAHSIHIVADPDDAIEESDDSNNTQVVVLDVRPKPDLAALAADAVVVPANPEEGDSVEVTALVRNLQPATLFDPATGSFSWLVRMYDGDESTGQLIAEQRIAGFDPAQTVSISGTIETTGRLGLNPVTIVADPEENVPDRDRANNRLVVSVNVQAATVPDATVPPHRRGLLPATWCRCRR